MPPASAAGATRSPAFGDTSADHYRRDKRDKPDPSRHWIASMRMFALVRFGSLGRSIVRVLGFEKANAIGQSHAQEKRGGKLYPVVRVKLHFGKQVSQRDAKEDAG